jgi:hypothetical protein
MNSSLSYSKAALALKPMRPSQSLSDLKDPLMSLTTMPSQKENGRDRERDGGSMVGAPPGLPGLPQQGSNASLSNLATVPPMPGTSVGLQTWLQQQHQQQLLQQMASGETGIVGQAQSSNAGGGPNLGYSNTAVFWDFEVR